MIQVHVKASIFIAVPIKAVWEITAHQFDKIATWSSGVTESTGHGVGLNGAVCKERQCTPRYKGFKKTTERIVAYQPENYVFRYEIPKGLPNTVVKASNTWTHEVDGNGTILTMDVNMQLKGLMAYLMKGVMKRKMGHILQENLEEIKVYAETGELHERKRKLNEQLAAV
ncbi:MAG: SRPBCC family protein [Bacteroidota bacterium]